MIDAAEVERVKAEVSVVDLLRRQDIEVRRVGANQVALCPFHREKTASFTIFPDGGWHCFGCGASGRDIIDFVRKRDGLEDKPGYAVALRRLGARELHGLKRRRPKRPPPAPRLAEPSPDERLAAAAASQLRRILTEFACDPGVDLWEESPIRLDFSPTEDCAQFLRLFNPQALLWTGEVTDTGKPWHSKNFRRASAIIRDGPMGSRVAPGVFRRGSISRAKPNVVLEPFIVVECDDLIGYKPDPTEQPEEARRNQALNGALIRWLRDRCSMRLAAVVDTGGKSLHGYFLRPPADLLRDLVVMAPALCIDDAGFDGSHPFRLPGFTNEKTGRQTRLLYLDTIH